MSNKKIVVSNGYHEVCGETTASNRNGYIECAKKLWPNPWYTQYHLIIKVYDSNDGIIADFKHWNRNHLTGTG